MAKIALSLSGGGYRAATFHLGTLSYLNHLTAADGTPLLDHVMAVSTISGGSLTGLWFILGKCRGWSNEKIISSLYEKLLTGRIIDRASLEFFNSKNNNHSLIREMVRIYDEEIFEGATLGDLMEAIDNISIDHFSANATEFNNATEFRFQVGKRLITEKGGTSQGVLGNAFYKIPQAIAAQIHLAEVFAASSCFPGGFEPLFFPRDFKLSNNADNRQYVESVAPLALMDGGVVDNQGIEPICLLRKRTDIDLFIISDAGCGQEKPFTFEENHSTSFLTMHHVNMGLNLAIIAMAQFLAARILVRAMSGSDTCVPCSPYNDSSGIATIVEALFEEDSVQFQLETTVTHTSVEICRHDSLEGEIDAHSHQQGVHATYPLSQLRHSLRRRAMAEPPHNECPLRALHRQGLGQSPHCRRETNHVAWQCRQSMFRCGSKHGYNTVVERRRQKSREARSSLCRWTVQHLLESA